MGRKRFGRFLAEEGVLREKKWKKLGESALKEGENVMKLREKIKRFWTLDVHNHEGFTLVELIIVIAILAILSSVAVVGYSSYITKANKQADQTLIAEIIHAAELYGYSANLGSATEPAGNVLGYVVITDSIMKAGGHMEQAMVDALGTGYTSNKLQWNGWTNAWSTLNNVQASIAGSSYVNVGTDALLGDVQHCASSLAELLRGGLEGKAGAEVLDGFVGGNYVSEYVKGLSDSEITADVLANAVVFALAAQMSDTSSDAAENVQANMGNGNYILCNWKDNPGNIPGIAPYDEDKSLLVLTAEEEAVLLTETAATYAALEAFCAYIGYPFDLKFQGDGTMAILLQLAEECNTAMNFAMADATRAAKAQQYLVGGQAVKDADAFLSIMGSVNDLKDNYKGQLNDTNLFDNQEMLDRVNGYMAVSNIDAATKTSIQDAIGNAEYSVIILFTVSANGSFGCTVFEPSADPRA